MKPSSGFTLVEILVVILIIGVLLGITLISPIMGSVHQKAQEEAFRLDILFSQIRDKALISNTVYGFSVDHDNAYHWWIFSQDDHIWRLITEKPYQSHKVDASLKIRLHTSERRRAQNSQYNDGEPSVIFYSDDQVTPFSLAISSQAGKQQHLVLHTDGLSNVQISK